MKRECEPLRAYAGSVAKFNALEADIVIVNPRPEFLENNNNDQKSQSDIPILTAKTYALARQEAPEWDVYYLEEQWRMWITEPPRNADKAFLGFCRKWLERRGRP